MRIIAIYYLATKLATPFAATLLNWRARRGKEDQARLGERMGVAARPRPKGRLIWLHGVSLGESLALLPLIERLIQKQIAVLVTTSTPSSAQVISARLPAGAFHQYAPLDAQPFIDSFLTYWRPDMALFAETELWPNTIAALRRRQTPFILVNARISQKSTSRWRRAPNVARDIFGNVTLCLAQDSANAARFLFLGAPEVRIAGNLKFDAAPLPVDPLNYAEFSAALTGRRVWAAVSTHAGEEALMFDAHEEIARQTTALLTIIVPRHRARGPEIAQGARAKGLRVALRSQGERLHQDIDVYIVDTVGEVGMIFRAVSLVFMGKSLVTGGGQNPIEPAKFGCAILHGPQIENFSESYRALTRAGAALCVADAAELARIVSLLLQSPVRMRRMGRAGSAAIEKLTGASRKIMAALEPYLLTRDDAS